MATTTKISKKEMQQDEFLEKVFDLGDWLEVHWKKVAIGAGVAVALILLGYAFLRMREGTANEANDLLAKGMSAYAPAPGADGAAAANPDYATALASFDQAIDKAGSLPIGAVAKLYKGRTLIALGRASEAVPVLESVASSGNARLAPQAKVALAQAAHAAGDTERAATLLQEVAAATDGMYPPDAALTLLAHMRESQGKKGEAKRIYDDIAARFPNGAFAADARTRSTELGAAR
jgi:tetratricopeptide (TPR) repeat protein